MKTLQIALISSLLCSGVFSSAFAQHGIGKPTAKKPVVHSSHHHSKRPRLYGRKSNGSYVELREHFAGSRFGIADDDNLSFVVVNFITTQRPDEPVAQKTLVPKNLVYRQVSRKALAATQQNQAPAPDFVPYTGGKGNIRMVGFKEWFSATPAEAPQWVGTFGLTHSVGVAVVSKRGGQVVRVSVAHVDMNTVLAHENSWEFFAQSNEFGAEQTDIFLLSEKGDEALVTQLRERFQYLNLPNPRYVIRTDHAGQFAVNTQTGEVSTEITFPTDVRWTDQDELRFNYQIMNILTPNPLTPSPLQQAVSSQRAQAAQ